jgi:hypothetical protein
VPAVENRRFLRYDVSSTVELAAGAFHGSFETQDLGAGGCRITIDRPLEKGTGVTVRLRSEKSRAQPSGQARVAWASHAEPFHVGLAFSDDLAEQVIDFMQDLLGPVQIHTSPAR